MTVDISMEFLHRRIVEKIGDAILFSDKEGIIRLWNQGAERIFGFTAEDAVGRSLDLIIPDNLRARHWDGYYRVMESGETKYKTGLLSSPGIRKDGSRISLAFSMLIVRSEEGEILGCASILRDVTAQWQKEKDLKERIRELEGE
jgi:PAS domain S-box-containing protein